MSRCSHVRALGREAGGDPLSPAMASVVLCVRPSHGDTAEPVTPVFPELRGATLPSDVPALHYAPLP